MSIILYLGPMWSSKTSRLISEYKKWNCLGKKTLVINSIIDDRYGQDDSLYTHDQISIPCVRVNDLKMITDDQIRECEAIFINEGQFFTNLKTTVLHWCEDLGKHIYVVGLDGDRNREKFGEVLDLMPYSDHFEKLKAKCKLCLDGTDALFTYDQLSTDRTKSLGGDQKQIRVGFEQYLPLCRKHYLIANTK